MQWIPKPLPLLLFLGLSACKLECIGDGPTSYDSVSLKASSPVTTAGGAPITLSVETVVHCSGFPNRSVWSLAPQAGSLEDTNNEMVKTYRPPASVPDPTDVTVSVRLMYGTQEKGRATITLKVAKP